MGGRGTIKHKPKKRRIKGNKKYIAWRTSVFKRDKNACQRCGVKRHKNVVLQAHHVRPWSLYPTYRYDITNGITLCRRCHFIIHKSKDRRFLILPEWMFGN